MINCVFLLPQAVWPKYAFTMDSYAKRVVLLWTMPYATSDIW